MNRTEFYRAFADYANIPKYKAKEICFEVFDFLAQCIRENDRVYIMGLGTFKKKHIKARKGFNIQEERFVDVPSTDKVVFRPYAGLLDGDFTIEPDDDEEYDNDDE